MNLTSDPLTQVPAIEAPVFPPLPHYEAHVLDNGMPVWLVPMGTQPVLELQVVYRGGGAYEAKSGLDAFTLPLLAEGTRRFSAVQLAQAWDDLGAHYSVQSGAETSTLSVSGLTETLPQMLPLMAELMLNAQFPAQEYEVHHQRVAQRLEVEQRKTGSRAMRAFVQALFGVGHPYAGLLTSEAFSAIHPEDVMAHYYQVLAPGRASVYVAGQFDPEQVLHLLNTEFGRFTPRDAQPANRTLTEAPALAAGRHMVPMPDNAQSTLRVGLKGIARTHPDYYNLKLLLTVLGGYFGSRLMQNIREAKGYTYGITAQYRGLAQAGYLTIGCDTAPQYVSDTLNQVRHELKRLRTEPVGEAELEQVRRYVVGRMALDQETPFQVADLLKSLTQLGVSLEAHRRGWQQALATPPEALQQLARRHLPLDQLVEVVAGEPL